MTLAQVINDQENRVRRFLYDEGGRDTMECEIILSGFSSYIIGALTAIIDYSDGWEQGQGEKNVKIAMETITKRADELIQQYGNSAK